MTRRLHVIPFDMRRGARLVALHDARFRHEVCVTLQDQDRDLRVNSRMIYGKS